MMNNSFAPFWQHLKSYPRRLTLQQTLSLFLAVAFPFQIWTVYQIFKDVEWITARTNAGDAFGYAAYSLAFALLESAAVFGLLWLLGLFTPAAWKDKQLLAILSWAGWMLAFWAGVGELLASLPIESIDSLVAWLFATGHPLRWAYLLVGLGAVSLLAMIALPMFGFVRKEQASARFQALLERTAVLTTLLIGFDLVGVLVVLIRNL